MQLNKADKKVCTVQIVDTAQQSNVPLSHFIILYLPLQRLSRDKLTLELFARGHMFSVGVSALTLNSASQTSGIKVHRRVYGG